MTGRSWLPLTVAALSAVAGFAAIYVTLGGGDNGAKLPPAATGAPTSPSATATATATATTKLNAVTPAAGKLNVGEVTAFVYKPAPTPLEAVTFKDARGADRTLADWKGKVVLLNLWATWCAPCRKEMPSLARLQQALGSKHFEVVALALDRGGAEKAQGFLDSVKANALKLYIDTSTRSGPALRVVGMPTTILIDRQGREIGRLTGPAEWDSPEAQRLVQAAIDAKE